MSTTNHKIDNIVIKKPSKHDIDSLVQVFSLSMRENFSYFPQRARDQFTKQWQKDVIADRIDENSDLLVCAYDSNSIVGFISGTKPEGGVATIIWLNISPKYQSSGIGKKLLNASKHYYKNMNAHKVKLTVHDKRALNFYLRENFQIEGKHPNHWWNLNFYSLSHLI